MTQSRTDLARQLAKTKGYDLDADVRIGGRYVSLTEHQGLVHLSGQVPRIGDRLMATGAVGDSVTDAVSLDQARLAAQICILRTLALLQQAFGLERVTRVLKIQVFVQSAANFTQQSEVADAASDLLVAVFGAAVGSHARTSVGVSQLPKNAAVEIDMTVAVVDCGERGRQG